MDEAALYAPPLAVDDAHAPKTGTARLLQIFHHDALHIARRDSVEIENVVYLKADGFGKEVAIVVINVKVFRGMLGRSLELIMRGCVRGGA